MPKRELDPRLIYYVYILFDWLGVPRYVGKGKGDRVKIHAKTSDASNWLKNEFIERTWIMLEEIPYILVQEAISEVNAIICEITLIESIGRMDLGTGPLTNRTNGGDGLSGHIHSSLARLRMAVKSHKYQQSQTPEQRSERARLREANMEPGARREASIRGAAKITAEAKRERGIKGASVFSVEELVYRLNGRFTFEERSKRLIEAFAKMTPEERSERARNGGLATAKLLTSEEQSRRAQKGSSKIKESKSNTIWINNGVKSKQQKRDLPIPDGWVLKRLPYKRNIDHEKARAGAHKCWVTRRAKVGKLRLLLLLLVLADPQIAEEYAQWQKVADEHQ